MSERTVLHQLAEQGAKVQMMSFVIQTRSGRLVVIDGGNKADADYLLEYLRELGGAVPEIDAWFLTHAHRDHIDAFMKIMSEQPDSLNVHALFYNFPTSDFIGKYEAHEADTIRDFERLLPDLKIPITVMREGDVYALDNVSFTVLYTTDPSFTMNAITNSGTVLRMDAEGQRVLFLADLGIEAGRKLLAVHGADGLKSELVQMAHHGQSGVTREVYEAVSPKACLWCTPP